MQNIFQSVVLFLCFLVAACLGEERIPYEIVYTNGQGKKIERYSQEGRIVWDYPADLSWDVSLLQDGNILFCYNKDYDSKKHDNPSGVLEITPDKKIVFEYKTTGQVFSCVRLPNGNTVVGAGSQGKLLIVDKKGNLAKEITLKNTPGHSCMRYVRVCRNGDFLVAEESAKKVRRYDADSKLVREISLPYTPFGLAELPNDNILISGRSGIREIAPDDTVVWEFKAADFPELGIRWCAGIELLQNGNILVVNAGGTVRLFEVARTSTPKIVWQVDPNHLKIPAGHGIAINR
ncbi:hypothetical protein FACS18942_06450 [Planctomycetales bacterium]|nr:hypothetical protein FACS18942_06450 [Planctomycetales bacterium]